MTNQYGPAVTKTTLRWPDGGVTSAGYLIRMDEHEAERIRREAYDRARADLEEQRFNFWGNIAVVAAIVYMIYGCSQPDSAVVIDTEGPACCEDDFHLP